MVEHPAACPICGSAALAFCKECFHRNGLPDPDLIAGLREAREFLRRGKQESRAADRQIFASRALDRLDTLLSKAGETK